MCCPVTEVAQGRPEFWRALLTAGTVLLAVAALGGCRDAAESDRARLGWNL